MPSDFAMYLPHPRFMSWLRGDGTIDILFQMGRGLATKFGSIRRGSMSLDLLPEYGGTEMTTEESEYVRDIISKSGYPRPEVLRQV